MTPSAEFVQIANHVIPLRTRKLMNRFFITFSRFEYALKASADFYTAANGKVEANWNRSCNTISNDFHYEKPKKLRDAVEYILQQPPRVQNKVNGAIVWEPRTFPANATEVIRLGLSIRSMRNNLFHGGKWGDHEIEPDVSRNYLLLNSAVIILDHWLSLNDEVRGHFFAPIA